MWIKKEYDNPTVYITGNGMVDNGGTDDIDRVEYYNSYLTYVLQAINDGANVKGYVAYSLLDSFEWEAGFSETFGLYHVDFNSPNKTRSAKMSAKVYKKIVETRKIDETYKPDPDFLIEPVERDDLCKKSIIPRLSTKEDKEGSSKQGQGRSTQGNSGQIKSFNFLSSFLIIDIIFVFKYIFG